MTRTGTAKPALDHVQDLLTNVVYQKELPFYAVLMDTWYATKDLLLFIESLEKIYYCPLRDNRSVDDAGGTRPYQRVDSLTWSETELQHGKRIKIKGFPKDHKVQCFRARGVHTPHGLRRHERCRPGFHGGDTKGVRLPFKASSEEITKSD